jgi:hypothetical protein
MAQSFYPSALTIINDALLCIRAVDPENTLTVTTTQQTNALTRLNMIVTSWQALGMEVWCQKQGELTLVAGTTSYTLGVGGSLTIARPLAISDAWLHNITDNTDPRHLEKMGREDYNRLTAKNSQAPTVSFWYDPSYDLPGGNSGTTSKGTLYVYPTPDSTTASTYTLRFTYSRPLQDFAATSDSLDFPQEWYNALTWNLAAQLCPSFGVPVMYWDRIKAQAKEELDNVKGWDHDDGSIFIQPTQGSK